MSLFKREKEKVTCSLSELNVCPLKPIVSELEAELKQLRCGYGISSCDEKIESKLNRFSFELSEIRGQLSHLRKTEEQHTLTDRAVICNMTAKLEKVESAVGTLRTRTDKLRTEQLNINERLKALECRQNAITIVLKTETGDQKIELSND